MLADRVITVGASAGGVQSIVALVASLLKALDAAVFVVLHIPPNFVSNLPQLLSKKGPLPAVHPMNGDKIKRGQIYVAPPDHHLLLEAGRMLVTRGPKENRFRPSIDALFRSAAYTYGPRAIGIVLSGALDDGTSGLWSVKRMGGVTIVQDPSEASFDSMPASALSQVEVDHCLPAHRMGEMLDRLIKQLPRESTDGGDGEQRTMETEISVAMNGDAFKKGIMDTGPLTSFTCPECHGVLVKLTEGKLNRFRCYTGHAYSSSALLASIMETIDASYWGAMRSLEEAAMLLEQTGRSLAEGGEEKAAALFLEQAQTATQQSRSLRETVLSSERFSVDSLLNKAKA